MFGRRGTYEINEPRASNSDRHPSSQALARGHVRCSIHLLDDNIIAEDFPKRVSGKVLIDLVNSRIDLQETDYFGLQYVDSTDRLQWLDPLKSVRKQIKGRKEMEFFFRVKFYIADPSNLQEELTRFLFFLQVKQDILRNRLPVNFSTAAILSAYALQAEVGDYDSKDHTPGYVSIYRFVRNQTEELEEQIEMHHKTLTGMLPADCEFHFLERSQRLELYGVDLHFAQDAEGEELMLGVTHSGVAVFQNKNKINSFHWAMMRKIGFKKHKFFLYIRGSQGHPSQSGEVPTEQPPVVGFILPDYRSCKALWKTCVAHHTFFRQRQPSQPPKLNGLLRFGSKYRYSGRTLNMTVEHGKETVRPDYELRRSASKKYQRRGVGGYSSMRESAAKKREEAAQAAPEENGVDQRDSTPDTNAGIGAAADVVVMEPPKPTEVYDEQYYQAEGQDITENYPTGSVLPNGMLRVTMMPDQGRFGFNVRGGSDQKEPVKISKITAGMPADLSKPRLQEGDLVEEINGTEVEGLAHEKVVGLILETRTLANPMLTIIVTPKVPVPQSLITSDPSNDLLEKMKRQSLARMPNSPGPQDQLRASIEVLKESLESSDALTQFGQLYHRNQNMQIDDGFKPENFCLNRYRDISPYNATRVRLDADNDYINASHVTMEAGTSQLAYIAAQGPLQHTCDTFWEMIWEQNVINIVMVTKLMEYGRQKCYQYWPESGRTSHWNLDIILLSETEDDTMGTVRHIQLIHQTTAERREVYQYQYSDWPDHGQPSSSSGFVDFVSALHAKRGDRDPLLVHCSAGVGRTGMFITMETALCMMDANEPVFPLELVQKIRDQRPMVIQTAEQYKFVCEAIVAVFDGKAGAAALKETSAETQRDSSQQRRQSTSSESSSSGSESDSSSSSSGSESGSTTSGSASEGGGHPAENNVQANNQANDENE
ncbi:tyrosine-protein phosphatase non-receptor type 4-like [Sycon ciliatum]|uniref:tyrosine-protein phosphatase non-receptor type 4-like n=1 Tax=Sycon ciliatum TaxID=27933 RepID=UPI0031F63491